MIIKCFFETVLWFFVTVCNPFHPGTHGYPVSKVLDYRHMPLCLIYCYCKCMYMWTPTCAHVCLCYFKNVDAFQFLGLLFISIIQAVLITTFRYKVLNPCSYPFYSERCRYTLYGHTDSVNSIEFFPFSNTLLTASADKNLSVWDARTVSQSPALFPG